VSSPSPSVADKLSEPIRSETAGRWLSWLFCAGVLFSLFFQLGAAALFEPDEGRNAEKAREILVLNDWITPHENFHPVLDKPIFFYWLIALSFKLFGISEWAGRLPSALAALGCLGLVYYFARARWGEWQARWSALILLTSAEFFSLSRTVIFDMSLTLFVTLALWAFYEAIHAEDLKRRRLLCLSMYLAFGAGTLIKGLVGVVVPGMVIFFYLLLTKQWSVLRKLDLVPGALIFLAITLSWYLQADAHNQGYLRYYFWDEHFRRFATTNFDRTRPWYYYIIVGLIGFFPWTFLLPWVAPRHRKDWLDNKTLFLLLWVVLPFLFFSMSRSKLPHYILPIFPALAILTGESLVKLGKISESKLRFLLAPIWPAQTLLVAYFLAGSLWPKLLPNVLRGSVGGMTHFLWGYGIIWACVIGFLILRRTKHGWQSQQTLFLVHGCVMLLFLVLVVQVMVAVSPQRSAREIATKAAPFVTPATQLVFYDTYMAGMAFYLRTEKPIWLITHDNKKRTFLGNYYALSKRAEPTTRWGKAMLDFDQFREKWQTIDAPLLVVVKEKNLLRLEEQVGATARMLATIDDYVLISKP
jgi:4-amino-4-deoxy-L-arabinose transferase-like glycosyltransferase